MAEERIVAGERIPLRCVDRGDSGRKAGENFGFAVGHSRYVGRRGEMN